MEYHTQFQKVEVTTDWHVKFSDLHRQNTYPAYFLKQELYRMFKKNLKETSPKFCATQHYVTQNVVLLFFKNICIKIYTFFLQLNPKRNFSICWCLKETKNLLIAQLCHQQGFVRAVLENHSCDVKKYKCSDKTHLRTDLCKKKP